MHKRSFPVCFASLFLGLGAAAYGQGQSVFLNSFGTGFDPFGFLDDSFSASTPRSELEALVDFRVINTYGFNTTIQGGAQYLINTFSSSAEIPDFRFTYLMGAANGQPVITGLPTTSSGGAMRLQAASSTASFSFRIEVGTLNGFTGVFTPDQTVGALGFTLGGIYSHVSGVSVDYYGPGGVLLSEQDYSSLELNTLYNYTGHTRTGVDGISYVDVTFTGNGVSTPLFGLDDIGFAPLGSTIPEPASYATLLLASVAGFSLWRRKPRAV